jgi:integrase
MASKPYPDFRTGVWIMKWRPDPTGKWKVKRLGKDPKLLSARPPKTPPQFILDRHREFEEQEYRAKHGLAAGPARAKGLSSYLTGYVEAFSASHKKGSIKQLQRHVKRFEAFATEKGATSVQGVTRSICRDYLESRIIEVSHDTLKTEMRYLSPIWSRAVEDGLMVANPWSRLKIPGKSTRSDPVFWTGDEVARIAACCSKPWQTDLVMVLANTGLRISTTLALRWDWIDWETGVITIPKEAAVRTEGVKTSYKLGLNRVSRDVLQRRLAMTKGVSLVFPNPYRDGGEVPYDSAREAIARAIRKAGVKKGTPHDLRHTYARLLDRSGIPASIVQSQLGHKNAATTRIYTDATAEEAAHFLEDFGVGDSPTPPAVRDPSQPPT